jgi:gas vesicle protein
MSTNGHTHGYLANNTGGFFAGLLMGGLIGAGSMLLLAPQSGKKTRAQIQHGSLELRDQVVETVEDTVAQARGQARRVAAGVQRQTKELQQRGQDMFDEQREVVSQVVEAEKTAVHNIANG